MSSKPFRTDSSTASSGKQPKDFVERPDQDTQHCKEDALSDYEFELLTEATYGLDDGYFALETRWVVMAAGRLGMRVAEIAHMQADWIDWDEMMIEIPRHYACDKGRNGGICGECRQSAKQMVDHHEELTQERAEHLMWSPKTEAGARSISLAASTRAEIAMRRYFDRFDEFQVSQQGVNRRVNTAAAEAPRLDESSIYPHALRSTAATRFAARDLSISSLKQIMGWANLSTAQDYISESAERTKKELQVIF